VQERGDSFTIAQRVEGREPGLGRHRPLLGRHASAGYGEQRADGSRTDEHGQSRHGLPAHLEVAGPALIVRRVEHERDPVGSELVDGVQGEAGEDAPALVVGVGCGVDRAHRPRDTSASFELPAEEDAETCDALTVDRDPRRRAPERVLAVLPHEEPTVLGIGHPTKRCLEQFEYRRLVGVLVLPDLQVGSRSVHPASLLAFAVRKHTNGAKTTTAGPARMRSGDEGDKGKVALSAPGLPRRRPSREAAALTRLNERAWPRVTPSYRALDFDFAVRTASDDLADYVERLLAPLATDRPARHLYSVVDDGARFKSRYALYFEGQHIVRTPLEPLALAFLLWHVNQAVVVASDRYLLLHAAAAAYNGSAILLPAAMDSGKTTLVAGLVQRGCGYLTDEAAAIDPVTHHIDPYPKPLSIERGSWDVLADLRPELDDRFLPYAQDQWHVVPDSIRPGAVAEPCPARLIVSPRYQAGAKTTIEPISRAQAVLMLAENAFNFASHKAESLHTLAEMVRRCECYRLTIGSQEDACDEVMSIVERLEVGV
jgi:hypothetical protein